MRSRLLLGPLCLLGLTLIALCPTARGDDSTSTQPSRQAIQSATDTLSRTLAELAEQPGVSQAAAADGWADVAVFEKAARWLLRFDEFHEPKDAQRALDLLAIGQGRADQLRDGQTPWIAGPGAVLKGYRSSVDGSIQPLVVFVPDRRRAEGDRYPLEVVLHGRTKNLTEVRFLASFLGKPAAESQQNLVLHVFGRTNNAYRWAGETDVFEAIDAVKRCYPVDDRRVALVGFSMGGAGGWHLGLHHPQRFCVVQAGAGFTDTNQYLKGPELSPTERLGLRIYDAVDVAANAVNVPMAGYGGELDPQRQASAHILDGLAALGFSFERDGLVTRARDIPFLRVIGADTEHRIDPASEQVLRPFLDEWIAEGRSLDAAPLRLVTYTLRFNQAPWLRVERLVNHYRRCDVLAWPDEWGQLVTIDRADNAAVLGVDRHVADQVRIEGQVLPLRNAAGGYLPQVYYRRVEDQWQLMDYEQSRDLQENRDRRKAPGVQGPIDDAFTGAFLCVRGTSSPWNPNVQSWADHRLQLFQDLWARHFRGELPIKNDTELTASDIATRHIVLFGDPGSNRVLRELLPDLPIGWDRDQVRLGDQVYPAASHAPALIVANPRNPRRYVVVNSGHSFGTDALEGSNALLYPRLGDHAVFRLTSAEGDLVQTGFYDEGWAIPAAH